MYSLVSCLHAQLMHKMMMMMMPAEKAYLLGRGWTNLQATWLWETEITIGTSMLPDMHRNCEHYST
jgi:hypothetical protein